MNKHQKDLLRHEGFVHGFVAARDPKNPRDTLLVLKQAERAYAVHAEQVEQGKGVVDKPHDSAWHTRHLSDCRDQNCTGCKKCRRRCALTLAYGFEDHHCYSCRNPPSD